MKKVFTGITKGFVIAGIIIGCFVSLITGEKLDNFWVFLGGVFATIIVFSAMGMMTEISQNIAKCGEMLDKLVNGNQQNNEAPATAANNAPNPLPAPPADLPQPVNNDEQPAQKNWYCSKCGEQNAPEVRFCTHCGQPRLSKPQDK